MYHSDKLTLEPAWAINKHHIYWSYQHSKLETMPDESLQGENLYEIFITGTCMFNRVRSFWSVKNQGTEDKSWQRQETLCCVQGDMETRQLYS